MSQSQLKSLQSYVDLMNASATAHAFHAAVELGIFGCLATGQKTAIQVAEHCRTQVEPTELLLDALCSVGVVERYGDDFAIAQVMRLLPDEFRDLGDRYWRHLTDFVRTGVPIDGEADFHVESRSLQWMMTPAALELVRVLDIGKSRTGVHVLELSNGAAVCSLSIAYSDAPTRVTVVDHTDAIKATIEHAEAIGVSDRLSTIEGDYRTVELPQSEFDLVIVTDLTHLDQIETNRELFQRLRAALKPDGELAIVDRFAGQDDGELQHRLYRLSTRLRTPSGRVHTPHELQDTCIQAGFAKPKFAHLTVPPYTLGLMLAGCAPPSPANDSR